MVASGYVQNLYNYVGFQKEIYSDTGSFTSDTASAVFSRSWVHNGGTWYDWTSIIYTWTGTGGALLYHSLSSGIYGYRWDISVG